MKGKIALLQFAFTVFCFVYSSQLLAQTNIGGVINTYARVTSISGTTLNLSNIGGASSNYATFAPGGKVLIYQAKGASINTNTSNSNFGDVTNFNDAGKYEIRTITSRSGSQITVASLTNSYNTGSGYVQAVFIPEYTTANVTSTLTGTSWSSSTGRGGIVALIANKLVLQANVSANGLGFQGGGPSSNNGSGCQVRYASTSSQYAFKGEGIAENSNNRAQANLGNGGGGGSTHNGGGGGGSNFGFGGAGGDGWNCGSTSAGGFPGDNIDYAIVSDRVFFGGGGGGGQQNNSVASTGGNGGGFILILADTITTNCSGSYGIYANGLSASNAGNDGAGGGGAGGSIIINTNYYDPAACTISVSANGGNGGSVTNSGVHGGGGGGGTGPILSNIAPPTNVNFSSAAGNNGSDCNSCTNAGSSSEPGTSPAVDYSTNQIVLIDGVEVYSGIAPGGVTNNISVWLAANMNVSTASSSVSSWADITGNGNVAYQNTSSQRPSLQQNGLNFNPTINFDGNNDWLQVDAGFYSDEYWIVTASNSIINSSAGSESPLAFDTDNAASDGGFFAFGASTSAFADEVITHGVGGSSEWRRAIRGSYSIPANTPQIYLVQNNSSITSSSISVNGSRQSTSSGSGGFKEATNQDFRIGGNIYVWGGDYYNGNVAEIISYSSRNNATNRRKIASYLAVKYGITLDQSASNTNDRSYYNSIGTIVWNQSTNASYNNDVAGLAFDAASGLTQLESKSVNGDAIIQMKINAIAQNQSYHFWSNNNGALSYSSFGSNNLVKLNRTWKITESGSVGTVTVKISGSELPTHVSGNYLIAVADNNTFTSNVAYYALKPSTGDTLTAEINFEDGQYFSIAAGDVIVWTDNGWFGGSGTNDVPNNSDGTRNMYVLSTKDTAFITTQALVNQVEVASGAVLVVESNQCLETNGIINNEGTIIVNDKGSLKQNTNSANAGSGTYSVIRVGTTDSTSYNYWSAPMSGIATSSIFAGSNIFSVYYNNPLQGILYYSWVWAYVNHIMQIGRGYIAQGPAPFTGQSNVRRFQNSNINNGNYSINVFNNLVQSNPYNLLGNPYPSGLNATQFLSDNSAILEGTIWLWDHNTANPAHFLDTNYWDETDYAQYTAGSGGTGTALGGTVPDGIIGVAQGFFVQVKGAVASGTVNFNNGQRTCVNNQFFKPETQPNRLWLNVLNNQKSYNQTLIAFVQGATDNFESFYDGVKLKGSSNISLYSVIQDTLQLGIQGVDELNSITDKGKVIELGLDAWNTGEHQFQLDAQSTIPNDYSVILEDRELGIYHNLKLSNYVFSVPTAQTFSQRFFLNIAPIETTNQSTDSTAISTGLESITQNQAFQVFEFNNELHIQSNTNTIQKIELIDIAGRVLYEASGINNRYYSFLLGGPKAMKLLRIYGDNGAIETKKIIY